MFSSAIDAYRWLLKILTLPQNVYCLFYVYAVDIVSSCNVEWPALCIIWHMSQIDSWLSIKHLLLLLHNWAQMPSHFTHSWAHAGPQYTRRYWPLISSQTVDNKIHQSIPNILYNTDTLQRCKVWNGKGVSYLEKSYREIFKAHCTWKNINP